MRDEFNQKPKILIVTKEEHSSKLILWFQKTCLVFVSKNSKQALRMLKQWKIDIILADDYLERDERGVELLEIIAEKYGEPCLCLMTNDIGGWHRSLNGRFRCIEKQDSERLMTRPVLDLWLLKKQKSTRNDIIEEIENQLSPLSQKLLLEIARKQFDYQTTSLEEIDYRLMRARKTSCVRSIVYYPPGKSRRVINICISNMVGCFGECRMCRTGKNRKAIRLTDSEMGAQFLAGLKSSLALESLSYMDQEIKVLQTVGGDFIFNPENSCKFVERIDGVAQTAFLNIKHVIPTIGNNAVLKKFLPRLEGRPVKINLSVHSFDQVIRPWLLPMTKSQCLFETREILSPNPWTLNWMLKKDLNDGKKDIKAIVEFCKDWHMIDQKIMLATRGCLPDFPRDCNESEALRFVDRLNQAGLNARYRVNVGGNDIGSGISCGTTVSYGKEWRN